jgi:flagellar basal-body rod protein FlgB
MNSDIAAIQLLQNALDVSQLRQRVYANNIANVDTPGFKRQDVNFESLLAANMSESPQSGFGQRYIPIPDMASVNLSQALQVQPQVVTDTSTTVDNNGNNVDVDAEMSKLAENQIHYNAIVQDLQSRFSRLKNAINGGGA